jgi:hypothetical protein
MADPTLDQQAAAVERAAMNLAGHVEILRNAVQRSRRPAAEFNMAMHWLPALRAAAQTMRAMASRREAV